MERRLNAAEVLYFVAARAGPASETVNFMASSLRRLPWLNLTHLSPEGEDEQVGGIQPMLRCRVALIKRVAITAHSQAAARARSRNG